MERGEWKGKVGAGEWARLMPEAPGPHGCGLPKKHAPA